MTRSAPSLLARRVAHDDSLANRQLQELEAYKARLLITTREKTMPKGFFGNLFGKPAEPPNAGQVDPKLAALLNELPHLQKPADEERRLQVLQAAVALVDRHSQTELWSSLQGSLAALYADRANGDLADNLEKAIQHGTAALEVLTLDRQAEAWAMVHHNLSHAYVMRFDGDRADNLQKAEQHANLALQVFTPRAYPNQAQTAARNLAYIQRDARVLFPTRPGNIPQAALNDWQIERWKEHEAEQTQSSPFAAITDQNFQLLKQYPLTEQNNLNEVVICSSRWAVARTAKAWLILDLRNNGVVVTHPGSQGWLEMVHLGPYAALEVSRAGVTQVAPLAMLPYQHATLWEYDTEGDSTGTAYDLVTGQSRWVASPRPDMSDRVWFWKTLDLKQALPRVQALEGSLSGFELSVQPDGWVQLQDSNTHAFINKLQSTRKNLLAAALTPDCRTLLTLSDASYVDAWHVAG
jgi:hypothetical protein